MALGAAVAVVGPKRRAHDRGRGPVRRLLRDRAGEERADRRAAHPGAGPHARGLSEGHHRLGRRLAGARRRGRARGRRHGDQVGARRRQRRDREGDAPQGRRSGRSPARPSTTRRSRAPAMPPPTEAEFIADVRGSAAYKRELMRVYVGRARAPGARRARSNALMTTTHDRQTAQVGAQVGRSLPRLEARDKVTGRAEYTHTMRLPGMLHGKIFRSTVAHGRIKSIDTSAAKKVPGVYRVVTVRRRAQGDSRALLRAGLPRPADPGDRQGALRRRAGRGRARRRSARRRGGGAAHRRGVRGAAGGLRRGRGADIKTLVHDELKPAGTFADLKHLKGRKDTNIALDFRLRRGDVDKAFAEAAHVFEHTFRTQKVLHLAARAVRLDRRLERDRRHDLHRARRARRSCAPRSRACSAGRRTGCASRCRFSAAASAPSSTSSSRRW